jgi:RNA polymerase sigma-70 factor (ECF subfamily)
MEDLFQEVWMVVVRRFHDAPGEEKIRSWIYSIAIRVCKGHRTKQRRRTALFKEWITSEPPATFSETSPSIDELLRIRLLWIGIGQLPRLQREVVLLRIVDEFSTAETAAELQRAEGTVKATLHHALNKLKMKLDPPGEADTAGLARVGKKGTANG